MRYDVVYSKRFLRELKAAGTYISKELCNPTAASALLDEVEKKANALKDHSHKEVFKKAILTDTDKYTRINSCIINHKIAKPHAITTLLSIPLQINYIS